MKLHFPFNQGQPRGIGVFLSRIHHLGKIHWRELITAMKRFLKMERKIPLRSVRPIKVDHLQRHPLLKNHHEITGYNLSWHISQGGTGEPGGMGPPGLIGESVGTQSFTKSDTKSNNFSFYVDKNFVPE